MKNSGSMSLPVAVASLVALCGVAFASPSPKKPATVSYPQDKPSGAYKVGDCVTGDRLGRDGLWHSDPTCPKASAAKAAVRNSAAAVDADSSSGNSVAAKNAQTVYPSCFIKGVHWHSCPVDPTTLSPVGSAATARAEASDSSTRPATLPNNLGLTLPDCFPRRLGKASSTTPTICKIGPDAFAALSSYADEDSGHPQGIFDRRRCWNRGGTWVTTRNRSFCSVREPKAVQEVSEDVDTNDQKNSIWRWRARRDCIRAGGVFFERRDEWFCYDNIRMGPR
jgi:hypothetical protein